jgi:4'-phosphopantetheinyl transferase
MKLTPRRWSWNGTPPEAARLAGGAEDVPMVWLARTTEDPAVWTDLVSVLSAEERVKLERFKLGEDQLRFLTGRGLLRILIGARLDLPPPCVELGYGPFGKPFLSSGDGESGLHFNVSHSGELVLLAIHPAHEVGVDVEKVCPDQDWAEVARRAFSADEYCAWAALNPADRSTAFFRAWTRHEAALKALGLGFFDESSAGAQTRVTCCELVLPEGYQGAVAWLG